MGSIISMTKVTGKESNGSQVKAKRATKGQGDRKVPAKKLNKSKALGDTKPIKGQGDRKVPAKKLNQSKALGVTKPIRQLKIEDCLAFYLHKCIHCYSTRCTCPVKTIEASETETAV